MYNPMRTSSILVDTNQNKKCGHFSLPSDIHQSVSYAYNRKYLNIVNFQSETNFTSGISASYRNFQFFKLMNI